MVLSRVRLDCELGSSHLWVAVGRAGGGSGPAQHAGLDLSALLGADGRREEGPYAAGAELPAGGSGLDAVAALTIPPQVPDPGVCSQPGGPPQGARSAHLRVLPAELVHRAQGPLQAVSEAATLGQRPAAQRRDLVPAGSAAAPLRSVSPGVLGDVHARSGGERRALGHHPRQSGLLQRVRPAMDGLSRPVCSRARRRSRRGTRRRRRDGRAQVQYARQG